jgi:hypothetical protein
MIVTIINALKFLIVTAITFVIYYPKDKTALQNAQIAVVSVAITCFFFVYIFYFFLRLYYLDSLEKTAY